MDRRVLIVGGAGYIGSVMTRYLLDQGYHVRNLDLLLYQNQTTVMPFLDHERYDFVYGDLCKSEVVDQALQDVTDVVVLAGLVGDPITKKYPTESGLINDNGIQNLLKQFNGKGLNQVIFVSTCSNYGLIEGDQLAAEDFELNPLSLYAKSKVAAEKLVLESQGQFDYSPTVLRFATAFGLSPRMRFDLTVNEFTREMFLKNDLLVFDADTWRPYCHVKDFSRVVHKVFQASKSDVAYQVFNAGGEVNNCTKQMIVDKILSVIPDAPVRYKEHGSDPRNYRVDFSKIKSVLDFEPEYTVMDGVNETVQALGSHLFDLVDRQKAFHGNYIIEYQTR